MAAALAAFLHSSGPMLHANTFVSEVDGVRYECEVPNDAIAASGGYLQYKVAPDHTFVSEPKGKVSLAQAMALAEKEAIRILKEGYTAEDPRWILTRAERKQQQDTKGNPVGFYYGFNFNTRDGVYSSKDYKGAAGYLQIIVLLDGTVMQNIARPK
ncbi:hypothetical protein [Roseimicrobium gellanilyticum]|uniref:hypothetical protein n=1 Tax=Roseimicrobium gellanilyticum TaxID=748857 RepID=UPI0011BF3207|nr:hypothetical protein [Roseimicrobium gellanilyticum]